MTLVDNEMKNCVECGAVTKYKINTYQYKECGLNNVYLKNVEVEECTKCNFAKPPFISNIITLHEIIGHRIALQPFPLSGAEVRFLRKHLGLASRTFANWLRIAVSTLSRWENEEQQIGPQSDLLIRLVYYCFLGNKEGRVFPKDLMQIIERNADNRNTISDMYIDMRELETPFYKDKVGLARTASGE